MQGIEKYKPGIRFSPNGEIFLASPTAKLLELTENDAIDVVIQDPEIYLVPVKNATSFHKGKLRPTKRGSKCYRTNWKELSQAVLSRCNCSIGAFRLGDKIEFNGKFVLPIITRINYAV